MSSKVYCHLPVLWTETKCGVQTLHGTKCYLCTKPRAVNNWDSIDVFFYISVATATRINVEELPAQSILADFWDKTTFYFAKIAAGVVTVWSMYNIVLNLALRQWIPISLGWPVAIVATGTLNSSELETTPLIIAWPHISLLAHHLNEAENHVQIIWNCGKCLNCRHKWVNGDQSCRPCKVSHEWPLLFI